MSKISKQVSHPDLFKRIISSLMDILVITLIFSPLTSWFNTKLFLSKYGDFLAKHDVDYRDSEAMAELFTKPEMLEQMNLYNFLDLTLPALLFQMLLVGIYFIASWHYIGTSPMKYLLSMKIVDAQTHEKPKLINLIWRFLGYILSPIGLWWAIFTKKKQALHDKMGNTIVVKS